MQGYAPGGSGTCCYPLSPIVVDVTGQGFSLTDIEHGVLFRMSPSIPYKFHTAWTAETAANAWLALDRNRNGIIDDVSELFGNLTPQPKPPAGKARNGFLALAVFDQPKNGGNGDGVIDRRDTIFQLASIRVARALT